MGVTMKKLKIGFICVHNSCRSIMAEGICLDKYGDMFEVFSAGSEQRDHVNADALRCLERNYNVVGDFNSKLIETLPPLDVVITMGCNVSCPTLACTYREDFGLDDPSGMDDMVFDLTAKIIELKLDILVEKINSNKIMGLNV
jgi:arsenate reductase